MKKNLLLAFLFFSVLGKTQVVIMNDTVPVIIHVINSNEAYGTGTNLDSVQIYSQFKILNDDFNAVGFNVQNVPSIWTSLIAQTGMHFVPALYDPQGNTLSEPGIDRIPYNTISGLSSPGGGYSMSTIDNIIKPNTIWPPSLYCNIWVLKLGGGLNGYTTLPNNSGLPWLPVTPSPADSLHDGIIINYNMFGDTLNVNAPFDKGRTCTHEMGHWFGLVHLYNNCAMQYCADLPPGIYNNAFGTLTFPDVADSCTGYPDGPMFMNFMTYVDDANMNMFSTCQGDSMIYVLHHAPYKNNLQNSWVYKTVPTSVKNYSIDNFISVFPNPSNGNFTILRMGITIELLKVTDVQGREILSEFLPSENLMKIFAPPGIYFMKLFTNKGMLTKKVVIE